MTRELTPEESYETNEGKTPDLVRKGERRAAGADTPSGPLTDRTPERAIKHNDSLGEDDRYPKAPSGSEAEKPPGS